MRRIAVLAVALSLAATGCRRSGRAEPTPVPTPPPLVLTSAELERAVLTGADVGAKWKATAPIAPTVLIGGEVGPANVELVRVKATSSFKQKDASGYLNDTLLLAPTEATARAIMLKHQLSDDKRTWIQERNDGGKAVFRRTGRLSDLPELGDEMYTAKLVATVTDADGRTADRSVEYVAFRIRNLIGFVVTQDAHATVYARRLEPKVVGLFG